MSTNLTSPLAKYPHSRKAGNVVFLAGQGCRDPQTNECIGLERDAAGNISSYCIATQTTGVLENIKNALRAEGLGLKDLVDVTVFLKDMADFSKMNLVWNETFAATAAPTRTTVAVVDLPHDNFVEMKAIAFMP